MRGIITALTPQERRGGRRINVFLDERYALSLSQELAESLSIGQLLDDAEFERLLVADERARAIEAALRLLGYRPRSESELRQRLALKKHSPSAVDAAIDRLRELQLVDDEAFARYWLEQRQAREPRGRRLVAYELRRKGVSAEVVTGVTEPGADEAELAYRAGLGKVRTLKGLDDRTFRQRLGAYLQRRGFDWTSIKTAVRRIESER